MADGVADGEADGVADGVADDGCRCWWRLAGEAVPEAAAVVALG